MTPKQQRFVEEYLVDRNATEAAKRAGYSERTAHSIGHENLTKPEVAASIAAASERITEDLEITAERVVEEIARMALYDVAALVGVTGPDDVKALPEDVRRAIVGWHWDKNGHFTLKLADKGRALDQLARYRGIYNDKVTVGATDGLADRLRRAHERVTIEVVTGVPRQPTEAPAETPTEAPREVPKPQPTALPPSEPVAAPEPAPAAQRAPAAPAAPAVTYRTAPAAPAYAGTTATAADYNPYDGGDR